MVGSDHRSSSLRSTRTAAVANCVFLASALLLAMINSQAFAQTDEVPENVLITGKLLRRGAMLQPDPRPPPRARNQVQEIVVAPIPPLAVAPTNCNLRDI